MQREQAPAGMNRLRERESPLVLVALLGQALVYGSSLLLARQLPLDQFDDYVLASAAFLALAPIAALGSDRYALRILPVYIERGDSARVHGYLHFARRRIWRASALLSLGMLAWALWPEGRLADNADTSIAVAALAVPLAALAHLGLEALTALGAKFTALALFRIAVPAIALACIGVVLAVGQPLSAPLAMACWGPGWLAAVALMARAGRRRLATLPPHAQVLEKPRAWRAAARPGGVFRWSLALFGQSPLLALGLLQASDAAVGSYAAAVGTVGLAGVLAAATNRAYARRLAILLERRDNAGILQLRRERLRWLLPALAVFGGACLVFGDRLLALFRPEFAGEGGTALRLLALSAVVSVLLSLSPTYLRYQRRRKLVYTTLAGAVIGQALLLLLLVPPLGATGAALASTIATCAMYGCFAWLARRELRRTMALHTAPSADRLTVTGAAAAATPQRKG